MAKKDGGGGHRTRGCHPSFDGSQPRHIAGSDVTPEISTNNLYPDVAAANFAPAMLCFWGDAAFGDIYEPGCLNVTCCYIVHACV